MVAASDTAFLSVDTPDFVQQTFESLKSAVINLTDRSNGGDSLERRTNFEKLLNRFVQRYLLDPLLPAIIPTLISYVLDENCNGDAVDDAYAYLYMICRMRNYKVVARHLPYGVELVERVLNIYYTYVDHWEVEWQKVYVTLVWLTVLCKAPFRFDCYQTHPVAVSMDQRIFEIFNRLRNAMSGLQDLAAVVMAEFITRPDTTAYIDKAFDQCIVDLGGLAQLSPLQQPVRLSGWLKFLTRSYKTGRREELLPKSSRLYAQLKRLSDAMAIVAQDIKIRKRWANLIQRIAMVFLKPRKATWAYNRGLRSLQDALAQSSGCSQLVDKEPVVDDTAAGPLCDEVEEIIGLLLLLAQDKETDVRWAAARGIGRISSRLNKSRVEEVVLEVLAFFGPFNSSASRQGGCLVLAELGRRGLLMAVHLGQVVDVVKKTLLYDEISLGLPTSKSVRDSACYLCWSFGRAFEKQDVQPYALQIARALLNVMLFDREVNCRRAASAAFQENVGRLGVFPDGVAIFTAADYDAVSNVTKCYTALCQRIGSFPAYTRSLGDHLLDHRVADSDPALRRLAAEALHLLVSHDRYHLVTVAIPRLLAMATGGNTFARHGAVLALGRLTAAIFQSYGEQSKTGHYAEYEEFVEKRLGPILRVPGELLKAGRFVKGCEVELWNAVGDMLQDICLGTDVPVPVDLLTSVLRMLDENLLHPDYEVRQAVGRAYKAVASQAGHHLSQCLEDLVAMVKIYTHLVETCEDEWKCSAAALALGSFPKEVLNHQLRAIIDSLGKACRAVGGRRQWVVARESCLNALCSIGVAFAPCLLEDDEAFLQVKMTDEDFGEIFDSQVRGLADRTRTGRGDVALRVRRAAVVNLQTLLAHCAEHRYCVLPERLEKCFNSLVVETLDTNARLRESACNAMANILLLKREVGIHCGNELRRLFLDADQAEAMSCDWMSDRVAYAHLSPLLSIAMYKSSALFGYLLAAGNDTATTSSAAGKALFKYFDSIWTMQSDMDDFFNNLIAIFQRHLKVPWMTLCFVRVAGKMLLRSYTTNEYDERYYEPHFEQLYQLVQECCKPDSVVARSQAAVTFYCGLFQFTKRRLASDALQSALEYLTSPLSVTRQNAAAQLYETLSLLSIDHCNLASVMETLEEADWSEPRDKLLPLSDSISLLLTPLLFS